MIYFIEGLMENQQVNYELFIVLVEGCLSDVYFGGCIMLECLGYMLELEGVIEICEGLFLDLALLIEIESLGFFILEYIYNGLMSIFFGL